MTLKEKSVLDDEWSQTTPLVEPESIDSSSHQEEKKIDITRLVKEKQKHLVKPAGVGGAIVGFIFGGPLLSALLGFGSAYAVRKENGAGDAARALGEMTKTVQDKADEIEDKNKYLERSKETVDKVTGILPHTTREFFASRWLAASNYTRDNQLIEKGVEGTGKGIECIGSSIAKLFRKSDNDKFAFVSTDEVHTVSSTGFTELSSVTTH